MEQRGIPDYLLLLLTFILVGFGLIMVFSASSMIAATSKITNYDAWFYTKKQIIFAALGTVVMFVLMNISLTRLKKWFIPFFLFVTILLLLVPFVGVEIHGARSWFRFGSFLLQPTEFAKLAVIMYLSILLTKKGDKISDFQKGFLPSIIIVGFITFLIMLQPDLGSTVILILSSLTVILISGARIRHFLLIGAAAAALFSFVIVVYLLLHHGAGGASSYKMARINCFIDPMSDPQNNCFQSVQALYAFGHGGFYGAGFGQSIQKLYYLPESHNDFIFAIIGEELGFVGAALFLLLYLLFLWRGIVISLRCPDLTGSFVGFGITAVVGIQAFINVGGVTGTIPMTGVTLPFISYGGSSLLVTLASVGILLSISREYTRVPRDRKRTLRLSA